MRTNIFQTAVALSDSDLLARTKVLAADEREATAELVAHLAVLEMRRSAYAALGHGSLYAYCREALGLSEDAACNRIAVTRWCRQFPVIADLMAAGMVSLTAVRLLGPHLTSENHQAVLAKAANKGKTEIQELVAALAPQPDLPASVRKLPAPRAAEEVDAPVLGEDSPGPAMLWTAGDDPVSAEGRPAASATMATVFLPAPRPVVKPTAPDRYRVQCTIGRQAYDELRQVQALLRREIPGGDPGLIFERALHLLLEQVEKAKLGTRSARARRVIRSGTDNTATAGEVRDERLDTPAGIEGTAGSAGMAGSTKPRSRHIAASVRAAVWERDGARCAFMTCAGQRCTERTFLEFHHLLPYARRGPGTADNIALRCRRHNQYEGELDFGPRSGQEEAAPGS
jgi:hypothetical protein